MADRELEALRESLRPNFATPSPSVPKPLPQATPPNYPGDPSLTDLTNSMTKVLSEVASIRESIKELRAKPVPTDGITKLLSDLIEQQDFIKEGINQILTQLGYNSQD